MKEKDYTCIEKIYLNQLKNNLSTYLKTSKKIGLISVFRFGIIFINLLTGLVISRTLLEVGRGEIAYFYNALSVFHIFTSFGLTNLGLLISKDAFVIIEKTYKNLFALSFWTGIVLLALGLIYYQNNPMSQWYHMIFIPTLLFYNLSMLFKSILSGQGLYEQSVKIEFLGRIGFLGLIVILYLLKKIFPFLIFLYLSIEYLSYIILAKRHLQIKARLSFSIDFGFLRENLRFNFFSVLHNIFFIVLIKSDYYIIKYYFGNFFLGIFANAIQIVENLMVIPALIQLEFFAKLNAIDNYIEKIKFSKKLFFFLSLYSLVVMIIIYLLAPWIVALYFKNKNQISIDILRISLFSLLFMTVYSIVQSLNITERIKKTSLLILLFCLLLKFISVFLLIHYNMLSLYTIVWTFVLIYLFLAILSFIDMIWLKKRNYQAKLNKSSD